VVSAPQRRETIFHNAKAGIHGTEITTAAIQQAVEIAEMNAEVVAVESDVFTDAVQRCLQEGADRILIAGGDGTVARAARVLAHTEIPLGILPVGGANNFAAALGLPTRDLGAALDVLKKGTVRAVSLGQTDSGYLFTETAGVGLFADGLHLYGGARQNWWKGVIVYLRLLAGFRATTLRITLDGRQITRHAVLCTVANGFRMADFIPVAPDASLEDNVFDVVLIGALHVWELPRYFAAVRRGHHPGLSKVSVYRAREVVIEAANGVSRHVHADDHIVGATPVTFTLLPAALRVVVPAVC